MVPTKLTLSNFMCYRADGQLDGPSPLDLDGLHVVCLSGENGSGKSALLEAITWALWGKARMPDDDLIAQGQSEMFVELEFRLDGRDYRVRRARQRGGTGKRGGQTAGKSQLDLQLRGDVGWRPLGEAQKRETQAEINDVLRMSYQTFINASFLLQGRADEFTARTPGERKEVLADILDLGEYEALAQKAKERAKDLDGRLKSLRGEMEGLRDSAAQLAFWTGQVAEAEQKRERLSAEVAEAEQAREAVLARRGQLEARAEQHKTLLRRLEELRRERAEREQELARLRGRIAQDEAVLAKAPAIRAGLDELASARAAVERLGAARRQYDDLARRQAELRQQFTEAKNELREQLRAAEAQNEALARRAARREQLRIELDELARRAASLVGLAAEHERRAQERQSLQVRAERLDERLRRRDALQAKIKLRLDSLVGVRENRREAIARLEQQIADEPRWRRDLEAARDAQVRVKSAETSLAELRAREQAQVDQVTTLRAAAQSAQAEGEKLKRGKALLDGDARVCPVCRNELGVDGVARVHAHYDEDLAALRATYAGAKREADQGEARLRETRAAVVDLEAPLAELRAAAARVESLETQLTLAAQWRADADVLREEYAALRRQIEADEIEPEAQAELLAVVAELKTLGDPAELAQERRMLDERLAELERRLREGGQIEGARAAYVAELRGVEEELTALPSLEARIAELRRVIETNDFAHAIRDEGQSVRAALETLAYSPEAHSAAETRAGELRRWEEEERAMALAAQRLDGDRASMTKSEQLQRRDAEDVERLTREGELLAEELRDLPRTLAAAAQSETTLRERQQTLQVAQHDLGQKQGYVKVAQAAADRLAQREADEQTLVERQGLFAELAEAFGKKGVQAMLIESAIPQIEDEANRLLARMTDGQMHLSFEMQRDTKKGDTVETLEIKIADALGTRVYDAFSGGEAMRANFAVRIALSRLLARRAGARLETLVIDEGFGTLDALGRERMIEAITSVQDDFRRIIVITHIDELKDRFPAQIEVTKTPAGSRWEIR